MIWKSRKGAKRDERDDLERAGAGDALAGCTTAGFYLAGRSGRRRKELLLAVSFLGEVCSRLAFCLQPAGELIEELGREEAFRSLPCLQFFLQRGETFPKGWRSAVMDCGGELQRADREVLSRMESILGAYELQIQLEELSRLRAALERSAGQACRGGRTGKKLYTSLGPLAGPCCCASCFDGDRPQKQQEGTNDGCRFDF